MSHCILLGHGSRNPEANEVLHELANMFSKEVNMTTEAAFLQFAEPSLENVIESYFEKGVHDLTIIPVFLYPGVHIKEDVPGIIDQLQEKYPTLTVKIADPIGADPKLVSVLQDRANSAK